MAGSRHSEPRPDATGHQRHLLSTLARHGRFAAAATLFCTAHRTTGALNALLAALCCSSRSPTLLRVAPAVLLRAAPHAAPDAATFRILTSALCRAGQPTAAAELLRCMPPLLLDPDPRLCSAVLASLCHRNRGAATARDALAFLDDMRRWGVPPARADYRAVVGTLLREGMDAEAYEVVARRMDSDGIVPGLPEFERLLRAFRDRGRLDAVEEVFDEMLIRGIIPCARVYNVYLGALCDGGNVAAARRMLGCMERAACPPDTRTFGVVAAGCVAAGDLDTAREVAREAVGRGLRWDAQALSELVAALRASGHVALARPLLLDILRDGCCAAPADVVAFEQLIGEGALCASGEGLDADEVTLAVGETTTLND